MGAASLGSTRPRLSVDLFQGLVTDRKAAASGVENSDNLRVNCGESMGAQTPTRVGRSVAHPDQALSCKLSTLPLREGGLFSAETLLPLWAWWKFPHRADFNAKANFPAAPSPSPLSLPQLPARLWLQLECWPRPRRFVLDSRLSSLFVL